MGLWSGTKKVASNIVDIRVDRWMGLKNCTDLISDTKSLAIKLMTPQKATRSETFEEALERLNLTENDIANRKIEFTRLYYIFAFISVCIITYAIVMLFMGNKSTCFISFCLSLYSLSQAFKFNFWLFQVKNRKLGCTLPEWAMSKFGNIFHFKSRLKQEQT